MYNNIINDNENSKMNETCLICMTANQGSDATVLGLKLLRKIK